MEMLDVDTKHIEQQFWNVVGHAGGKESFLLVGDCAYQIGKDNRNGGIRKSKGEHFKMVIQDLFESSIKEKSFKTITKTEISQVAPEKPLGNEAIIKKPCQLQASDNISKDETYFAISNTALGMQHHNPAEIISTSLHKSSKSILENISCESGRHELHSKSPNIAFKMTTTSSFINANTGETGELLTSSKQNLGFMSSVMHQGKKSGFETLEFQDPIQTFTTPKIMKSNQVFKKEKSQETLVSQKVSSKSMNLLDLDFAKVDANGCCYADADTRTKSTTKKMSCSGKFQKTMAKKVEFRSVAQLRGFDCPVIIFVFQQRFVEEKKNKFQLKEIIKDVKQRCKTALPAAFGLILREKCHQPEERLTGCLLLLSQYLQKMFWTEILMDLQISWVYIPHEKKCILEIKKGICQALLHKETAASTPTGHRAMGVKVLHCFPWYGRRKDRNKEPQEPTSQETDSPQPSEEPPAQKGRPRSTASVSSDSEGHNSRAYFSRKARVSFRHEMDSALAVIDSTN
ncbi:uncharacterized protein LOC114648881 isoform X1 [Erpetoichthys calabaricus]|uniref:uncharacterized protein LOC114648881 isoform X1 n=1 Tax=Erpetoichthys calabaricus TaxID=27687 RepID=UPI00109F71DB|nr:uncharacterized protein LOC114648881 isoform X1 [Erpetoichthys calabaricus]